MKIELHGQVIFSQEDITIKDFKFDGGGEVLKPGQTAYSLAVSCALDWVEQRISEMRQEVQRAEFEESVRVKNLAWHEVKP